MSPLSSVRRKYDVCQRQRNQQRSQQPGPAALRTAFDDRLKHGPVAVQAVEAGYVAAIPFPQNDPLLERTKPVGPGSIVLDVDGRYYRRGRPVRRARSGPLPARARS